VSSQQLSAASRPAKDYVEVSPNESPQGQGRWNTKRDESEKDNFQQRQVDYVDEVAAEKFKKKQAQKTRRRCYQLLIFVISCTLNYFNRMR